MSKRKLDVEKERRWQKTIREAARSGLSIREFCRQHKLHESQFYWWQRKLTVARQTPRSRKQAGATASFALISEEPGTTDAGIELVLGDGRRLRIAKGVDEATLRSVLAVVQGEEC
jgi:transposase-like protein